MDRRKWFPIVPLYRKPACCYCGGPADTSDHTPPKCLLPRTLPNDIQAMTIPVCAACNTGYSVDEMRVAAIVATVSFMEQDRVAVASGGWINQAMQGDRTLTDFIATRLDADGIFRPDEQVFRAFSRIMAKVATGLVFHEFGRVIDLREVELITVEHANNVHPLALVEQCRRDDSGWAEVTPSGRELERQVQSVFGQIPRNRSKWKVYVPDYFEYMFIRRANNKLLVALKLHNALTALIECPWPNAAGPRRRGKPRKRK